MCGVASSHKFAKFEEKALELGLKLSVSPTAEAAAEWNGGKV